MQIWQRLRLVLPQSTRMSVSRRKGKRKSPHVRLLDTQLCYIRVTNRFRSGSCREVSEVHTGMTAQKDQSKEWDRSTGT